MKTRIINLLLLILLAVENLLLHHQMVQTWKQIGQLADNEKKLADASLNNSQAITILTERLEALERMGKREPPPQFNRRDGE